MSQTKQYTDWGPYDQDIPFREIMAQFKHQKSKQEAEDALGVLGGVTRIRYVQCDLCEHGKTTLRVKIMGPIHYYKQSPCKACRGVGTYRFVETDKGLRGHLDWERKDLTSGSAENGPSAQMNSVQAVTASPYSPQPQTLSSMKMPSGGQIPYGTR